MQNRYRKAEGQLNDLGGRLTFKRVVSLLYVLPHPDALIHKFNWSHLGSKKGLLQMCWCLSVSNAKTAVGSQGSFPCVV